MIASMLFFGGPSSVARRRFLGGSVPVPVGGDGNVVLLLFTTVLVLAVLVLVFMLVLVVVVLGETSFDPRAGGGNVNASSRDESLGGSLGVRSSEDWGVGGRMGRGMAAVFVGVWAATVAGFIYWFLVVVVWWVVGRYCLEWLW